MQRICVLGSTGSIGTNCLEVIRGQPGRMSLDAVVARRSWQALGKQTQEFAPRWAVLSDEGLRNVVAADAFSTQTEVLFGADAIERVAASPEVDTVVSAIVGAAGLRGTWAAIEAGQAGVHREQGDPRCRRAARDGVGQAQRGRRAARG